MYTLEDVTKFITAYEVSIKPRIAMILNCLISLNNAIKSSFPDILESRESETDGGNDKKNTADEEEAVDKDKYFSSKHV